MAALTYGAPAVSDNTKIDPHKKIYYEVTYISLKPGPGYAVSVYFTGTERAQCIQKAQCTQTLTHLSRAEIPLHQLHASHRTRTAPRKRMRNIQARKKSDEKRDGPLQPVRTMPRRKLRETGISTCNSTY